MNPKLFSALVGACAFVIAFSLGSIITATTGIPLAGGLINGVLVSMVLTIGMVASSHKWTATMMWVTFSIFAIPTTTLGPPGIYKPLIALGAGVCWDVCYYRIFNERKLGLYLGAIIGGAVITLLMILVLEQLLAISAVVVANVDAAKESLEKLYSYLNFLIPINVVVTIAGVWLGDRVYNRRLKNIIRVE